MAKVQPLLLIVTGLPCTGKTDLARRIVKYFSLPLISKDEIKESLFDSLGWGDREASRRYGEATYQIMYSLMETFISTGISLCAESNFSPTHATERLLKIRKQWSFQIIQVECVTTLEVLLQRWKKRVLLHERHPGHLDELAIPDFRQLVIDHTDSDGLARLGFLDLEGASLEVNTSDLDVIDYEGLFRWITDNTRQDVFLRTGNP